MLRNKYLTLYSASLFEQNKLSAENADCHDWNTVQMLLQAPSLTRLFKTNIYSVYIHLFIQFEV